jgi:energy-coupling factor transporter ATP-binding protein EcfA2
MSTNEEIIKLVALLAGFKPGKPLRHYITHATFPKFKSIAPGTRIDFEFPLTALVGANGIGKSSLLHALWGMPFGYSTSKFWFATELDPIEENQKEPQRYFYGYWNESFDGIVETRKARVGKKRGADYWEPYRWSSKDGMMPMVEGDFEGKAKDRWNPVKRDVRYINLKTAFGSFDRYFYFDEGLTRGDKREVMLREARRLKSIINTNRQSYKLGGRERLFENRMLNAMELHWVSDILGRQYEAARLIAHSLYPGNRGRDISVVFRRGTEYSEAFAGSGEVAAVTAVVQVLAAPDFSLILLDEPETSLHPGAQRALLRFLLEQVKLKKHQVVVSTHSPEFLDGLPFAAIKVFEDCGDGKTTILPRSSPSAAFKRLGKLPANKHRVLVEDDLTKQLVLRATKLLDHGDADTLEVRVLPGGADQMLAHMGPAETIAGNSIFVLLDGDKRKVQSFTSPDTIAPADYERVGEILRQELGVEPIFHISGGKDDAGHRQAKTQAQLDYLRWLIKHVGFLPKRLPEHVILTAIEPGKLHELKSTPDAKKALRELLADGADVDLSNSDLTAIAKVKIGKIPLGNKDLVEISDQLRLWIHG